MSEQRLDGDSGGQDGYMSIGTNIERLESAMRLEGGFVIQGDQREDVCKEGKGAGLFGWNMGCCRPEVKNSGLHAGWMPIRDRGWGHCVATGGVRAGSLSLE